jgi:hypothetical protein
MEPITECTPDHGRQRNSHSGTRLPTRQPPENARQHRALDTLSPETQKHHFEVALGDGTQNGCPPLLTAVGFIGYEQLARGAAPQHVSGAVAIHPAGTLCCKVLSKLLQVER